MTSSPVYLDHNASTPMDPVVIDVMTEAMHTHFANPSSAEHAAGAAASQAVEHARGTIAKAIGARPTEIIFCSGATEANNLALMGAFPTLKATGKFQIVTSAIEHPSVLEPLRRLEAVEGAEIARMPVGEDGRVSPGAIEEALGKNTGLVTIMTANNETGVLQPIDHIGSLCAERDILFHTDYSQATAYRALDVLAANVHLASFSGHKMYGPKGVGVLYRRLRKPRVELTPIIHGGGHERGLRSGTLNTPAIVAMRAAFEQVIRFRAKDVETISKRRDELVDGLLRMGNVYVNGSRTHVLPNTVSLSVEGVEPLALMRLLKDEIVFSASSACSTDRVETSHVLKCMFGDTLRARQAFRLGFGRGTADADVERAVTAFTRRINQLRSGRLS